MPAPIGNRFWEFRVSNGPNLKFESADELWAACVEYFEWVEANPLKQSELVKFQGEAKEVTVNKMRAMTLKALCRSLSISFQTWTDWRSNRDDLSDIITRVEDIIYEQKFTGAAADLLNPSIIARQLGLSDKSDVTQTGIVTVVMPDELSGI